MRDILAYAFFMMALCARGMMMVGLLSGPVSLAWAGECLDPTAGLVITGAVNDFNLKPSPDCVPPVYSTSFGPIVDYDALEKQAAAQVTPTAVPPAPAAVPVVPTGPLVGSGEGVDLYDLEAGTGGGAATQYNDKQLERIGELDALQGRPIDMKHARNLGYLNGYTRGSAMRAQPKPWR